MSLGVATLLFKLIVFHYRVANNWRNNFYEMSTSQVVISIWPLDEKRPIYKSLFTNFVKRRSSWRGSINSFLNERKKIPNFFLIVFVKKREKCPFKSHWKHFQALPWKLRNFDRLTFQTSRTIQKPLLVLRVFRDSQ